MNFSHDAIQELLTKYDLGMLIRAPEPIPESKQHQLWQVTTEKGIYFVKQFNAAIYDRLMNAELIEETEIIAEKVAFNSNLAISAIKNNDKFVCSLANQCYLIFPWLPGKVLSSKNIKISHCERIGRALGQIHQLKLSSERLLNAEYRTSSFTHLVYLLSKDRTKTLINQQDILWLSTLYECSALALKELATEKNSWVLSHTDIYPSNVIWTAVEAPVLIDWECTRYIHPGIELLGLMLNWGGITTGQFNLAYFRAVSNGYKEVIGTMPALNATILHASYSSWLIWLEYMLERFLAESERSFVFLQEIQCTLQALRLMNTLQFGSHCLTCTY